MNKKGLGRGKPHLFVHFHKRNFWERREQEEEEGKGLKWFHFQRKRRREKENSAGFRGTKTKEESFFYFSNFSKANGMFSRAEFAVLMADFFNTFFEVISADFWRTKISKKKIVRTTRTELAVQNVFRGKLCAEFLLGCFSGTWFEKNKFWSFSRPFRNWLARLLRHLVKISTAVILFKVCLKK